MARKHVPFHARMHSPLGLAVLTTVAVAALLRGIPSAPIPAASEPVHQYPAVAAAIGLTDELPQGSVLATYLYALLYGSVERVTTAIHPGVSALDFCAGFTRDPAAFAGPARLATAAAGVLAVCLLYLLISRLIDPWAGAAAALMLAIHPAAVALSRSLTSDPFCLVCLLGGLVVFAGAAHGSMRLFDFLPAGLLLGFATESLPVAWLGIPALLAWLVATAPASRRAHALYAATICAAAFALAAITVAAHLDIVFLTLVRAAVATAATAAAFELMRHLRDSLPRQAWSGLIVTGALLVSVVGLSAPGTPEVVPVIDPWVSASEWIAAELPPGTVIALDARLADRIIVPRTAESWRRELRLPERQRPHPLARVATGLRVACDTDAPTWDVLFIRPLDANADHVEDLLGAPTRPDYLILPEVGDNRPTDLGFWLVARFRPASGADPGVAIWGVLPDAAPASPPQFPWHIFQAPATS